MTSRFEFTKVGMVGTVVCCGVGLGVSQPALAASDGETGKAKGAAHASVSAGKPTSHHEDPAGSAQIGLGIGFYSEDSERRVQNSFNTREQDPIEYNSSSIYNLQAWYLQPFWLEGLKLGGGVAWFNKYSLELPDAKDDDKPYVVGQMFQLGLQSEYQIDNVVSKLSVVLGARGGAAVAFASGDLQREIDDSDRLGFDMSFLPPLGLYIAPLVGVRWPLSRRVAVRADLSEQFMKMWLYSGDAQATGLSGSVRSTLGTTRTQLLIGLDFSL